MTETFTPFIDIISANAGRAPFVKGGVRAYYATGSPDIMETAKQIAAAKAAGMGVILIDQTFGLALFAAGLADVADIEAFAGTPGEAALAVAIRQTHKRQSTLYVSLSGLANLKAHISNPTGVLYGVADYSWSQAQSEQLLSQHADWAYTQYGDNITNASTLVPGTNVTCGQAACDIDVAKSSWANQFLPKPPTQLPGPFPHWADGTLSLAQIAAARGASLGGLLAESGELYAKMLAASPMPKGTPWGSANP